jgi:hypothetical protein
MVIFRAGLFHNGLLFEGTGEEFGLNYALNLATTGTDNLAIRIRAAT